MTLSKGRVLHGTFAYTSSTTDRVDLRTPASEKLDAFAPCALSSYAENAEKCWKARVPRSKRTAWHFRFRVVYH